MQPTNRTEPPAPIAGRDLKNRPGIRHTEESEAEYIEWLERSYRLNKAIESASIVISIAIVFATIVVLGLRALERNDYPAAPEPPHITLEHAHG